MGDAYASIRYGPAASRPAESGDAQRAAIDRMRAALGSLPTARYLRRHAVERDVSRDAVREPALG
jgi:hypothetical protein